MPTTLLGHSKKSSLGMATINSDPVDTSAATLIVLSYEWLSSASQQPLLSDLVGGNSNIFKTLNPQTSPPPGNVTSILAFCAGPTAIGAGHVFTLHEPNGNPFFGTLRILWFSGPAAFLPLDKQNGNTNLHIGGPPVSMLAGSVNPSNDGQLIIASITAENASGGDFVIDSGFTISDQFLYSGGNNYGAATAYKIQTTAAPINPTWTLTPNSLIWDAAAGNIATFSTVPIPLPAPVMPDPNVTGSLAFFNASQDTVRFYIDNMNGEKWVQTCETTMKDPPPNYPNGPFVPRAGAVIGVTLTDSIAKIKAKMGNDSLIGTYISPFVFDDVDDFLDGYQAADPIVRIPGPDLSSGRYTLADCLQFQSGPSAGQYIRPYNIDWMNPSTRAKVLEDINTALLTRQNNWAMQYIETDNWIHTGISSPDFPYPYGLEDVLQWYEAVDDVISAANYAHGPNIGAFYATGQTISDSDIHRIVDRAEAIWYEGGTSHTYLSNNANIVEWFRRAELTTAAGCRILLDPNTADSPPYTFPDGTIADSKFICGPAMLLQGPYAGYDIFFPRATFDFLGWPALYGTPTGPIAINGLVAQRRFGINLMRANFLTRMISVIQSDPIIRATAGDMARFVATAGET